MADVPLDQPLSTPTQPVPLAATKPNGLAIAALVVGIVAFLSGIIPFFGLVVGVAAIVLGIFGLKKIGGKGMSIAGLALGSLATFTNLIVIVFFIIGLSAINHGSTVTSTGTDSSSSQTKSYKVGDVISINDKEVTVSAAERNWESGNQFTVPSTGNEFVKLQVTIKNNSASEVAYNTYDWQIQDSAGVIKDISSASYGIDGALGSGQLAPKGKVAGSVIFEVPSGDSGLIVRYSPLFWSSDKIEIKL